MTGFPQKWFHIYVPVLLYCMSLAISHHSLSTCWGQITITVVVGSMLYIPLLGATLTVIGHLDASIYMSGVIGAICFPIYSAEPIRQIKKVGANCKQVVSLLQGGTLFGAMIVVFYMELFSYLHYMDLDLSFVCWFTTKRLIFGALTGYLSGKLVAITVRAFPADPMLVISLIMLAPLTFYYVSVIFLDVSGFLVIIMQGIIVRRERINFSEEIDKMLKEIINVFSYTFEFLLFVLTGLLVGNKLLPSIETRDVPLILVTYMSAICGKFVVYLILAPILSRIEYGMSFRHAILTVWSCLPSCINIVLSLCLSSSEAFSAIWPQLSLQVTGMVLLSLFIQMPTVMLLLNCLELNAISLVKEANMRLCLQHINNVRNQSIMMMKLDRVMSDVNWSFVSKSTHLTHLDFPHVLRSGSQNFEDEEDRNDISVFIAICPECYQELNKEPSSKEQEDIVKEARRRILKVKKVSYARQYESGILTLESFKMLTNSVEIALESKGCLINISELLKMFEKRVALERLRKDIHHRFYDITDLYIRPPRQKSRRICYHIVMHKYFEYLMSCIVVINVIFIICELSIGYKKYSVEDFVFGIAEGVFFLLYLTEFLLKVFAYSFIYVWEDGIKTYFRSKWNWFDFFVLVVSFLCCLFNIFDWLSTSSDPTTSTTYIVLFGFLRTMRCLRILRVLKQLCPMLLRICDESINSSIRRAYDVGKGFVIGQSEALDMVRELPENFGIKEAVRGDLERDRGAVIEALSKVHKEQPWIAVDVKTRQSIRTVLKAMEDATLELKTEGFIDHIELKCLHTSLGTVLKAVSNLKEIPPAQERTIFREVVWMGDDENLIDYLLEQSVIKTYEPGHVVCGENLPPEGVYIIISGLFKSIYNPNKSKLAHGTITGIIPVVDYITIKKAHQKHNDYYTIGNSFGEYAFISRRPYASTITAESFSQVYMIPMKALTKGLETDSDPLYGLECRMWKHVMQQLSCKMLRSVPAYHSTSTNQIKYILQRAFVPDLSRFKIVFNNEIIQDILLIQGLVVDYNMEVTYAAPCVIPRYVQRLIMPKSSMFKLETFAETKLMILPEEAMDELDIMDRLEQTSELVDTSLTFLFKKSNRRRKRFGLNFVGPSMKMLEHSRSTIVSIHSSKSSPSNLKLEPLTSKNNSILERGQSFIERPIIQDDAIRNKQYRRSSMEDIQEKTNSKELGPKPGRYGGKNNPSIVENYLVQRQSIGNLKNSEDTGKK